jgi:hypothetical protein
VAVGHAHQDLIRPPDDGAHGHIFWAGDQRWDLSEGGVAFLPRNVPHAYRITSPAADMLAIWTPSGMEDWVRAVGWDLCRPQPDGWEIAPATMAAAAAATGQTINARRSAA